jgi:hypothetical protein
MATDRSTVVNDGRALGSERDGDAAGPGCPVARSQLWSTHDYPLSFPSEPDHRLVPAASCDGRARAPD